MTDPAKDYAWAAMSPRGRILGGEVHNYANEARESMGAAWNPRDPKKGWRTAYRDGWRVVRVELRRV